MNIFVIAEFVDLFYLSNGLKPIAIDKPGIFRRGISIAIDFLTGEMRYDRYMQNLISHYIL